MATQHNQRVLAALLASPPALRVAIARRIFVSVATKPLTTHSAPSIPTPGSFRRTAASRQQKLQSCYSTTQNSESAVVPTAGPSIFHIPPAPARPSRASRFFRASGLVVFFFAAGLTMAAAPASEALNGFVHPPTDAETLDLYVPATPTAAEVNEYIINHPLARKLRAQEGMSESRPHLKIPPALREHNLTGGTLLGENKIEVPPLTFNEKEGELPTLVQISYLGPALCGHPGIIHGGLLATMLDEGLARACFSALPNKVGVTASLKIDYRAPCPGSSYVVLKAQTTKVEGRKAWVTGWIELLGEDDGEGTKVVEASALFIEPKNAAHMARIYSTQ